MSNENFGSIDILDYSHNEQLELAWVYFFLYKLSQLKIESNFGAKGYEFCENQLNIIFGGIFANDETLKPEIYAQFKDFFSPFEMIGGDGKHYFQKAYNYLVEQLVDYELQKQTLERILRKLTLVFSQNPSYIQNGFGQLFLNLQYEIFVSQSLKHIKNFFPLLEGKHYRQKELLKYIFTNHKTSLIGLERTFEKLKSNLGYEEKFENFLNYHTNDKNFIVPEFGKYSSNQVSDDMIVVLNDILKSDFLNQLDFNNFEHIKSQLFSQKNKFENGILIDMLPDTQLDFLCVFLIYFSQNAEIVQKFLNIKK